MKVRSWGCITLAWVLGATATVNVGAWDGTGHMLIAQIARNRLNGKARARVDALASELDNNGVPYNGVTVACWPDDIKDRNSKSPFQGEFKPWHYIDIGCSPTDPDVLGHPPALTRTSGDVVTALTHCVDLIKEHKTDALVPNEAVALALVMHFVGDIHQPLHTTARYNPHPKPGDKYKDDAGGNGVSVANLGDTPWSKNLHTFWDEAYRRFYENGVVKASPPLSEATALGSPEMKEWMGRLTSDAPVKPDLPFDAKKWALESHEIACTQVYGTLGEPYGARDITLSEKYVTESTRTARRQIVLAGYRLGELLNELYGK
ncbi:MAG TPA: S1/P1 nuclease [Verrucomicrobiae bacterium]|nr:S1/P1 nuclease [Verrucomicrobiae bacterium]